MRIRARAATLCAAVLLVLVALPAAAQADGLTMDGVEWPAAGSDEANDDVVSSGVCPAEGETRTYTFSYTGRGIVGGAVGSIEEHGSFTMRGTAERPTVTAFESTFSGSSSAAHVEGTRDLELDGFWGRSWAGVVCHSGEPESGGAQDLLSVAIGQAHTEHRLTDAATGAVTEEIGYAYLTLASWPRYDYGAYSSLFTRDMDLDFDPDVVDKCPDHFDPFQEDYDDDGAGDVCDPDADNDSHANEPDNCDLHPNPDQADSDGDGAGDACDPWFDVKDSDGDGHRDDTDNCVDVANLDQTDSGGSALGDACEDRDEDGVGDLVDNCVDRHNPSQANLDGDALGDTCDGDDDNDTVVDGSDNCPAAANPDQRDADGDHAGDACDGAFDSTDGFAGGGGKSGALQLSVALHSQGGRLHGSGHLVDGSTSIRLLDLTGLRSDGQRVLALGGASVDGGDRVAYRLEIVDSTNGFELEIGDRRWEGTLGTGNLVVK